MAAKLDKNRYGKSRVRVMKVTRDSGEHHVKDWTVQVLVEGDFNACFVDGNNALILPTDTMKNTVYSRARASSADSMEVFAQELAAFFIANNPQISGVEIEISEKRWTRAGGDMASFRHSGPEVLTTLVNHVRGEPVTVISGVKGLVIMKTARSGFVGFIKDALTTLPEVADRIFCTEADIVWTYDILDLDFNATRERILELLLSTFAAHDSLSVQQSLYAMGEAALASEPRLTEIEMTMPNRHCLLVNLSPFGQDNPNEIFVPTDEPHGTIQARIVRR